MSYRWSFAFAEDSEETLEDLEAAGLVEEYATVDEAQAWLGDYYIDLTEYGVASVTLLDEAGTTAFGPMDLAE